MEIVSFTGGTREPILATSIGSPPEERGTRWGNRAWSPPPDRRVSTSPGFSDRFSTLQNRIQHLSSMFPTVPRHSPVISASSVSEELSTPSPPRRESFSIPISVQQATTSSPIQSIPSRSSLDFILNPDSVLAARTPLQPMTVTPSFPSRFTGPSSDSSFPALSFSGPNPFRAVTAPGTTSTTSQSPFAILGPRQAYVPPPPPARPLPNRSTLRVMQASKRPPWNPPWNPESDSSSDSSSPSSPNFQDPSPKSKQEDSGDKSPLFLPSDTGSDNDMDLGTPATKTSLIAIGAPSGSSTLENNDKEHAGDIEDISSSGLDDSVMAFDERMDALPMDIPDGSNPPVPPPVDTGSSTSSRTFAPTSPVTAMQAIVPPVPTSQVDITPSATALPITALIPTPVSAATPPVESDVQSSVDPQASSSSTTNVLTLAVTGSPTPSSGLTPKPPSQRLAAKKSVEPISPFKVKGKAKAKIQDEVGDGSIAVVVVTRGIKRKVPTSDGPETCESLFFSSFSF